MENVKNYLLGMDCGNTNIKAIILGEDGTIVAKASKPNIFLMPGPNMQEQDANEWWNSAVEILQTVTKEAGPDIVKKIRGICISSRTVILLPVDAEGTPLRNAITELDSRSAAELRDIVSTIGFGQFVSTVGGQPAVAFLPNKILWFKKNEPELFAKASRFLQESSYINFKLTGNMTMDIDQASRTQCLDINTLKWSRQIGDVIGVKLDEVLPTPQPVDAIIGSVTEEAAKATGLAAGIPVVAGASDAMASMYATGLSRLGEAGESCGTTSLVFVGSSVKSAPNIPVVTKPCAIDGIPWVFDAPIQASGASLKWFIETMAGEEREYADAHHMDIYQHLKELAMEAKPGSNGTFFFPYLLGERAPLWNEYARGMFIGLSMNMKRCDLVRSVFEGTAYALRHVLETIEASGAKAESLRICGGGAKNRPWSQIKASVLRMPVYLMDERSGDAAVGDALIVGHKVGVFSNLTEAVGRIIKVGEILQPIDEWANAYDKLYPHFLDMYQHLDNDLRRLKDTVDGI